MSRKIDALVAAHIMEIKVSKVCDDYMVNSREVCPHYSTDMAAAWEVVEKLKADVSEIQLIVCGNTYLCEITEHPHDHREASTYFVAEASAAAIAICLAALKLKGIDYD